MSTKFTKSLIIQRSAFRYSKMKDMEEDFDRNSTDTAKSQYYISRQTHAFESMDFEEMESVMWRKHQLRRFFQDRGHWWTASRRSTSWKWTLVIWLGIFIGIMGFVVAIATDQLFKWKFNSVFYFINRGQWPNAFFTFMAFNMLYAIVAGICCWIEPAAAGSGIPEIKAYLNGINLNKVVRIRVMYLKVIGVCCSVAASLPLGKEGPMIHAGAILGAAVSQGRSFALGNLIPLTLSLIPYTSHTIPYPLYLPHYPLSLIPYTSHTIPYILYLPYYLSYPSYLTPPGIDTTWTKFQDLRNDRSKRDFVTFGAAAGVAAAFAAPIGGILFTLEEGTGRFGWDLNIITPDLV